MHFKPYCSAQGGREGLGLDLSSAVTDGVTSGDLVNLFRSWVPNYKNENIEPYGFPIQAILGLVSFEIEI